VLVSDFHFDLPEELIAQHPPAKRGSSRMLVLNRRTGALTDEMFESLPRLLQPGDLLILNDSRVLPARLFAVRGGLTTQTNSPHPSGVIEVLLTEQIEDSERPDENLWRVLVKPARKVRVGETLHFLNAVGEQNAGILPLRPTQGQNDKHEAWNDKHDRRDTFDAATGLTAVVVAEGAFGERTLRFEPVADFYERVGRIGHMPLPPYIRRDQSAEPDSAEDRERYQTVYSDTPGSAAAPTAGLHFTPEVLRALVERGVEIRYITLHVGLGTFQPVRVERLEEIRLHAERYTLPAATAEALNLALAEGRRIVAVGTTTTRALEHIGAQLAGVDTRKAVPQGLKPVPDGAVDGTGEPISLRRTGLSAKYQAEMEGVQARVVRVQAEITGGHGEIAGIARCLSWTNLGKIEPHSGSTSIFLSPGHKFRIVSGLLTNFHLPESTLLMLVSAFAALDGQADQGREVILAAYAHAIRERYRFYSYGDCMLLL
jgi:S-adenosylmethionine:tRNA ribosyltransferase-isomerase